MNISSDVLPSIQYNTGANSTLSIDVQDRRSLPDKFMIRPKSQYEKKLLSAALLQTSSGIVISQADKSFRIEPAGGVTVLNEKLSKLKTTNASSSIHGSQTIDLNSLTHTNSPRAYQHNRNSTQGNAGAIANSHNTMAQKLVVNGKSSHHVANGPMKGSLNSKNNSKIHKGTNRVKLRRNSSKRKLSLNVNSHGKPEFTTSNTKAVKIYLSQKQSADIAAGTETDKAPATRPSAPPSTPSLEMLKKFEYVPSLSDNLAKQQIKSKLKIMKKVETEKERVKQADKLKNDIQKAKEREQDVKKQQRRAIYALNSIMTKAENDQFERFKSEQGLRPKEYPSTNTKNK